MKRDVTIRFGSAISTGAVSLQRIRVEWNLSPHAPAFPEVLGEVFRKYAMAA